MSVTLTPAYRALNKRLRANKRETAKIRAALAGGTPDAATEERLNDLKAEYGALVKEQAALILAEPMPVSFLDSPYARYLTDAEREKIKRDSGVTDGG